MWRLTRALSTTLGALATFDHLVKPRPVYRVPPLRLSRTVVRRARLGVHLLGRHCLGVVRVHRADTGMDLHASQVCDRLADIFGTRK